MPRALFPSGSVVIMPGCVIASAAAAAAAPTDHRAKETFDRFVDLMYRRRQVRAAFESCVAREGFIDRSGFASRATAMAALAPRLGPTAPPIVVVHAICEGDIGMVHLVDAPADGSEPRARVDIFRMAEGRIVEHWSVAG